MASVNTILFRRSATLNMFHKLDSTVGSPLGRCQPNEADSAVPGTPVWFAGASQT
jgi:hypothetical protein